MGAFDYWVDYRGNRAEQLPQMLPQLFSWALAFGVDSLPSDLVDWGPTGKAPGCLATTGG